MMMFNRPVSLLAASLLLLLALNGFAEDEKKPKPKIEAMFVLDTTGSMGGLINGAKVKIWSIAQDMMKAKPKPDLSMGLVGHRDRGDAYVTKRFDLSDDMDKVYDHLLSFEAAGGGDTPEAVNQALLEAVEKVKWTEGDNVYRVIFLVGDAPPKKYEDEKSFLEICKLAKAKGIRINAIQCGGINGTKEAWTQIAQHAGGSFAAIQQDGGMKVVVTPFDEKIDVCNKAINGTVVAWGNEAQQQLAAQKIGNALAGDLTCRVSRQCYAVENFAGKVISGEEDLVAEWQAGNVKLADMKKEELPETLKGADKAAIEKELKEKLAERERLQKELKDLVAKRNAFVETETDKRRLEGGLKDSFDENVRNMVREQAASVGLVY